MKLPYRLAVLVALLTLAVILYSSSLKQETVLMKIARAKHVTEPPTKEGITKSLRRVFQYVHVYFEHILSKFKSNYTIYLPEAEVHGLALRHLASNLSISANNLHIFRIILNVLRERVGNNHIASGDDNATNHYNSEVDKGRLSENYKVIYLYKPTD